MSRVAAFVAVVAAAVALLAPMASADPNVPWRVDDVADTPWQVAFVDFHYDCQANETVFVYNLTASHVHDLGHWTLSAPNCAGAELADDQEWDDHGEDGVSKLTGYRWAWGQPNNSSRVYVLRLVGEYGIAKDGEYAVAGDGKYAIGTVDVVPDCAAATSYPVMAKPDSITQDCRDELITAFPAGCVGDSCYKLVHTEVEYPVCQAEPHYTLTYRLEAEVDGCVWASQAARSVVFNDSTAPDWTSPEPVDATYECDNTAAIPPADALFAEDNCGIGGSGSSAAIDACEKNTTSHCPHHYYIVRSWTAIDDCGNERCTTQTITVTDSTAPTLIGVPDDERLTCAAVAADPTLLDEPVVTATDNCAGNLTADIEKHTTEIADECTNTFLIRRRWKVEDACGNEDEAHQLVTVYDDVPPVLEYNTSIPRHRTVECKAIPDAEIITAHDECADENTTVTYTQTPADPDSLLCSSSCNVLVTRHWTTCDDCGNVANLTRELLVVDRKAPTFDLAKEGDLTIECDSVPAQRPEPVSDVCDGSIKLATCTETRVNTTCEHEYVLTRFCEACDCCGNCVNRTRTITVVDTNITCPTAPTDESYQCNAIPAQTALTAPAQRCPETLGQTFGERPYTAACEYDIVRYWDFKDCANNTCTVEQTLSISDDIAPVFDSCPANTTADCHLPAALSLSAQDNCSSTVEITNTDENVTNPCPGTRLVKRTYTADDGCGNTVDCVQYIDVSDTTAPSWDFFPEDDALECDEEVNVETPRASDTCSNTTVVLVSDDTVYHGCANNYTRTITWKAVDQCGNTLGPRAQVIRVTDPSAPVLTEPLPADKVDVCHNISCPDDVFATDNCDGLNLTYKEERVEVASPSCDELYELHRTWTATDDCGQTDTHTQVITVSDPDAPVYNGGDLEDEEISCEEDIVLPTDPSTNWTDNCGDVTLVSITNRTTPSFECATNETVTVTWTVRDECGNTASVSKKYKIYDLTQPDIEDLDDKTFECDETVVLEEPWHNDTCSNTILTATNVTTPLDCPTTGYLSQTVRNFTATDLCGNQVHSSQVTRVTDTTDPVMTCPDAVITGTCCSVPPPAVLTATDNCADPQDIEAVVTRQNGSCVNTYNLTYTWTAYDQCDNFKQCVQTVVIVDDQVPTLEGVPTEDASAECEDVPKPEQVCAHDNCGPISLHFNETRLNGSCSARFTLRREWTAVDACGHDYSESYDLTVTDDNDPYWGALPSDDSRECDKKNVDPTFADPSCTDNCTVTDVTPSTNQQVVGCPGDIDFHFGWECADECGNSITHNITVEQRDTTDPQFIWAGVPPQDVSYDCAAPGPETPGVTDSCTDAFLSFDNETELDVNASCPIQRSWVRVWNVTDECDHFVVHRQKVSINRPGPPVFTTNVSDATIGCHSTEPATPIVKAKDACGNEISVSLNRTEVNHTCTEVDATASQYDIVRTWTAVDSCGQEISLVQVIRVRDMSPPTVTAPAPRTFHNKCVQQAKPTGATHSDDCISIINCTDEDLNVGTCPYAFDINTTFTATDNCGKQTSDSVRETYTYDKKPQVHDRENISTHRTARCDDVNTVPDTIQWQDGCGQNISGGELDTYVIDGACPNNYTLVWNYSITDYCGQSNFFVIRTHVLDESAPQLHFEWPVEDELVECPFVSPAPEATATDSCGGNVTIEFVEFKVGFDDSEPDHDCCNYDVFRVWKATDACGHTSTKTQRIQVKDTIPPVWVGPDIEDVDIVCPEVVERPNITWFEAPFAHGFCASATNSTNCTDTDTDDFQFVLDGQEYTLSNGRFVRWVNGVAFLTGEAVGASATYTVDFQFNLGNVSTSAGLAQSLANNTLKADCYDGSDGVVRAQWVFYEELVGNLTETTTGDLLEVTGGTYLQLGLGANGRNELYGLRTTLTATPEGGAALEGELALQLNDCNTSDWGLPELECGHELETTESFTHEEECIGRYTHVFIWNATDPAGNTNSTTMTVTSEDLTPPQFYDLPATLVTGVCAEPAVPTVKANDTCSYANISLSEGPKIPFGPADCEYKFTRVRTWTAIDDCLNPNDFVQNVEVEDDVDPTITLTGVPTNKTFDCYADLPAAATASCSDNCDDNVKSCTSSDNAPATPSNCNVFITYTYNAEDKCGNSETDSYTVHVNDVNAPVCISVGDDKELCGETDVDVPCADGVPAKKDAIYTDNCDGTITVTPSRSTTGTCPTIVVDTYTLVDSCGNVGDTFTKTYRIVDDVDPVITTPANRTVGDCTSWEIPAADENVTVSDVCDTSLSTVTHDGDSFTYEGDCLVLVTRHWSAVDACGNDVTAESYIHINDTSAPVFDPPSIANEVINCTEDVPCPPTVSITDGCDGVHLNYKETEVPGRCDNERVLVRTWTATDSCGNSATLTYNISITDTIDPEWVGALPVNESIECDEDAAGRINLNATDSCGPAPTTFNETRINGSCPHEYQLLREWVATDACGNSIDHSVTIHVNDTEAPTVADLTDKVHECDRTVPEFDVPTFNDNCDLESVTNVTGTTSQGCNGNFTVTNTWTGTDSCGNSETVDQDIVVTDTVAPRFTSTPQRVVNSTCTNGSEPFPTYEDDCSLFDEITATSTDELERLNLPCLWPYRIERSWTITDDCLHSTTVYQTVNVKDEDKPSLIWEDDLAPEDATVACDQIVPWTPVTANDPCQGDVTDLITNTSTGTPDACDWTETRFWEVCDCSGNCDNHTQVIHYVDEVAPVFDDVADAGPFVCNEAIVLPNATATDDQCTEETFEVQPTTVIVPGACTYNYTLVATYFVVDRCGNNNTVTKNFTHHDITPPVPDPVSDVTIQCDEDVPEEFVSCTDNCDGHISGAAAVTSRVVRDGINGCDNGKIIEQTYTCTDQCGNSASVSRNVTIEDTEGPQWTLIPQPDRAYQCDEDLPELRPTASDNCGNVTVERLNDTVVEGGCDGNYSVTHHWRATDSCSGLTNTTSQTFEVIDTTDPTLDNCPASDLSVECDAVPCPADVTARDTCPGITLDYKQTRADGDCDQNYTLTRTWTATDACGNTEECSHTITVSDGVAPEFTGTLPQDENYTCPGLVPAQTDLPYTDNCSNVTYSKNEVNETTDCAEIKITRTWTVTDECNNTHTHTQIIYYLDDSAPVPERDTCVCNEPVFDAAYAHYANPTELVSFGVDACGDASQTVTLESCVSDQDAELDLDDNDGFTADCHVMDGMLKVRLRASHLHEDGRLFNLTLKAVDGCGNAAYAQHYFWVPLDHESNFTRGYPDVASDSNVDIGSCVDSCIEITPPDFCAECPCKYSVNDCMPDGVSVTGVDVTMIQRSHNSTTDETHVVYNVTVDGDNSLLDSLLIGADAAQLGYEIVDVVSGVDRDGASLDFSIGALGASYLSGLIVSKDIFASGASMQLSVILRGTYGASEAVPVEVTNLGNKCGRSMSTAVGARIESANDVCGHFGVYGTVIDGHHYSDSRADVASVVVALSLGGDVVATTATGADGRFCFRDVADGSYQVYPLDTGYLAGAENVHDQSAEYLVADIATDSVFPHGDPQDVTVSGASPADLSFVLYLNNIHFVDGLPTYYADGSTDYFKGTSRSIGFWIEQLTAVQEVDASAHCPRRAFLDLVAVRAYVASVDGLLSGDCGFAGADDVARVLAGLQSADSKTAKLTAVVLNHASGHGLLEPYRNLQGLVARYAANDICNGGVDPSVEGLLDEILGAI